MLITHKFFYIHTTYFFYQFHVQFWFSYRNFYVNIAFAIGRIVLTQKQDFLLDFDFVHIWMFSSNTNVIQKLHQTERFVCKNLKCGVKRLNWTNEIQWTWIRDEFILLLNYACINEYADKENDLVRHVKMLANATIYNAKFAIHGAQTEY